MPIKEESLNLVGVLATAIVVSVGFAMGGGIGHEVMAGIGIGLTTHIVRNRSTKLREAWLCTNHGIMNHDIQNALLRAFLKSWDVLERRFFELEEKTSLSKSEEKSVKALFLELKYTTEQIFLQSIEKLPEEQEVQEYLHGDQDAILDKLWLRVRWEELLDVSAEDFKNFLRQNLFTVVEKCFYEELRNDNRECNRAWRAFQRLLLEGIQADVKAAQASHKEIIRDLAKLDVLTERLNQLKDLVDRRLPNEPLQEYLEKALSKFDQITDFISRKHEETQKYLQAEIEQLKQKLIQEGALKPGLKRELIVGLRPADVRETFKDRKDKLDELRGLLGNRTLKLVIIVGREGIGKTALLSKVFDEIEKRDLVLDDASNAMGADGIVYVSCRGTDKPRVESLYNDIARLLDNPHNEELMELWKNASIPLQSKLRFLLSKLRDGCYLLVLDNLEDLLRPDNTLEDSELKDFVDLCLTTAHGLKLIATSQRPLAAVSAGVHVIRTLRLDTGLPEDDAIALLRDVDPTGELTLRDAPEPLLRKVAQKTFGFPRALETIAGLLYDDPTLNLDDLLMDDSIFNAQVVNNLIAEHYRRVDVDGRRVLQALSIFEKPVPSAALKFLLMSFYPTLNVDSTLSLLVRNFFVTYVRSRDTYELHPMDEQYTYNSIPEEGDYTRQALHQCAADFYAAFKKPATEWKTIQDLEPQLDEFDQRLKAKNYDQACCLLNTMHDRLFEWGHHLLLRRLSLSLYGHLTDTFLQRCILHHLSWNLRQLGDLHNAARYAQEQLEIAEKDESKDAIRDALCALGETYIYLSKNEEAFALFKRALGISRKMGSKLEEGHCLGYLGNLYFNQNDLHKALKHYKKALKIIRTTLDRGDEAWCLSEIGEVQSKLGNKDIALDYFLSALSEAKDSGFKYREAHRMDSIAALYLDLGSSEEAIRYAEQSMAIAKQTGLLMEQTDCLRNLSMARSSRGEYEKAIELIQQAIGIDNSTGYIYGKVSDLLILGTVKELVGEFTEARRCYEEALLLNDPQLTYRVYIRMGLVCALQGDNNSAGTNFDRGLELCHAILQDAAMHYEVIYFLSLSLLYTGEKDRAVKSYRRALEVCSSKGVVQQALRDLELLQRTGKPPDGLQEAKILLEEALFDKSSKTKKN